MSEIKINLAWLGVFVSVATLIGFSVQGYSFLTRDIATKEDVHELKLTVEAIRIDTSIALIKIYLKDLDAMESPNAEQRREKTILEKKLQEYELKKVSAENE